MRMLKYRDFGTDIGYGKGTGGSENGKWVTGDLGIYTRQVLLAPID